MTIRPSNLTANVGILPAVLERRFFGLASPDGLSHPERAVGPLTVLHTKSRQEKALVSDLEKMGIASFLPLMRTVKFYGSRKTKVVLPLFPGYVFVQGSMDAVYAADRTKRVANIIRVSDQVGLARELASLAIALEGNATLDPFPSLLTGVAVEVRAGPFRGVRGVVIDRFRLDRVHLQVSVLGRGVIMEVDAGVVEVLHDSDPIADRSSDRIKTTNHKIK